jgi:pimeloyl-ACP methyl ester carboxylesterase
MTSRRFVLGVLASVLVPACTTTKPGDGKSYVLVHGAWMGAAAWGDVADQLRGEGADVVAIDLPGHGSDTTPIADVTYAGYVASVSSAIDAAPRPVILVGHSAGGAVISSVAEQRPKDLVELVYVAGFVPTNGQTVFGLAMSDTASQLGPNLIQGSDGTLGIQGSAFPDLFCADCSATGLSTLVAGYRPEPAAPFETPATLTAAGEGSVAKTYVHTADDRVISPALQTMMTSATPMKREVTLATSHAAMLAEPTELATALLAE